ncbi:malate dehydrogenase [Prochlorothrix hollandica]|uniref:Malate dehydrogenase n=2 Tax=Prochlorothrix hollandica TaxID=1223 RepID=A0A0M2PPN5_PROHO|nr:malate dehydrogenase [Prochlorothrix hollandica]KKI98535.1 malate dehydrogenase [Prochlorothrix hollandica PCC 9006 = CALU 1027]
MTEDSVASLSQSLTPPVPFSPPRVAVIGAGKVGSTLAQRLAEKEIADVTLLDVVPGLPQGIALDLMEARGVERHDRAIIGTNDYADLTAMDVVVITAGKPRLPGMSRDDLLDINGTIVAHAAQQAITHSPNALLLIVTNPLDTMAYVAWQATGLPPQRVLGMAGVLDSARFQTFIALELGVSVLDVHTMVLGTHGDAMVPLPRFCTINGVPITEFLDQDTIDRLVERTRFAGSEIVNLMKTGGAFYAPASAACGMVEAMLADRSRLLPAACYLQGEYGLKDIYLGVPCRLGRQGVEAVVELNLTDQEQDSLRSAGELVRGQIDRVRSLLKS